MNTEIFARIVFTSSLPALDREFEYRVASDLKESVRVGQRVSVNFSGQEKEGFIVSLSDQQEFKGTLSEVNKLISEVPVLNPDIYSLIKTLAARQCASVGELVANAVPHRSVRVERGFTFAATVSLEFQPGVVESELVTPVAESDTGKPRFISRIVEISKGYLEAGRSVIITVPDFRDVNRIESELVAVLGRDSVIRNDSTQVASERYRNFLAQLVSEAKVVIGTRTTMYSPISKDAALVVWDDGDQSHQDQQSPYLNTREIALVRQSLFKVPLHFLSHTRSTEVQRLVKIGYAADRRGNNWYPKVSVSQGTGLDGMSYKLIQRALEKGPVLVQVAAPGVSRSLYCEQCGNRSSCTNCFGPLWVKEANQISCRWCGRLNHDFKCRECGSSKLKQGAAGSTRWAEQLGKSFPGTIVRTIESADVESSGPKSGIVVSTPGIEPIAPGGFAAVVLMDCAAQLRVDSLRAPEDALRSWLNALAFMRGDGAAVAIGVSDEVSKALSLGQVSETVSGFLDERELLGFPPARRFLSATGNLEVLEKLSKLLSANSNVTVLGIATAKNRTGSVASRLIASFSYASGEAVAKLVREYVSTLGSKETRRNQRSGRTIRPVTIKFDDPRVI